MPMQLRGPDAKGVFVLQMNQGENRWNRVFFDALFQALDKVEANPGPTALVLTGTGKFFSNGFALDFLQSGTPEPLILHHKLMERFLRLSVPSVCAINGHAFAGGSMLALCPDYAIMNKEKGFLCANELDLGMAFSDPMMALFNAKLPASCRSTVVLGAERLNAAQLLQHGVVRDAVPASEVLPTACALAASHAKKGKNKALYKRVKEGLWANALAVFEDQKKRPIPLPPKPPAKL
eukprot:TRINITY_DN24117_c0_g1_i1.p1 TRINITY_DN24117_c0_g1~~TRINITY_DN24117_c0_g1_i1.p1  ORF type:complete len:236 (+),score=70.44 TRINITY_DN24117_c0_g1_i1:75-782(+)